jgi:hypothetical protein
MVAEEMRKVSEVFTSNAKLLDKRIDKLRSEVDVERIMRAIEKKLGKEEATERIEGVSNRVNGVEKGLNKML